MSRVISTISYLLALLSNKNLNIGLFKQLNMISASLLCLLAKSSQHYVSLASYSKICYKKEYNQIGTNIGAGCLTLAIQLARYGV
jgi:hypothetical protein